MVCQAEALYLSLMICFNYIWAYEQHGTGGVVKNESSNMSHRFGPEGWSRALGRAWANDDQVGTPLVGGIDNFTFGSPLFAYRFCPGKVATSFLEDTFARQCFLLAAFVRVGEVAVAVRRRKRSRCRSISPCGPLSIT